MSQQKQNILIVETKDGAKYQGIYVSKDIQKQIITLSNVKKTFQEKEDHLQTIEIKKDDIKSINILDVRPPKEDIHNFNEIPENKKNAIDEDKLADVEKAYDKSNDFFDKLNSMSKTQAKKESDNYNLKNKDTFNLSDNDIDNKRNWKKRGNKRGYRGRGGYGRGNRGYRGGYNNYYNYSQNRNNNGGNYNEGYQNYRGQNNRGRDRGRGRGRGNRGRYKNNNYNYNHQENNQNNNINNNQDENNKIINQA